MMLRLATRRSPLAMAQAQLVSDALVARGHEVELVPLVTSGDRWSATGGEADKGMFVKELEQSLLDGAADLAVHSAKDLPVEMPDGLEIVAVPPRADPRDALIGPTGGLPSLAPGSRIATGSARRAAQLVRARPDVQIVDIRGNVDTRLTKLADGHADALVLAAAGLDRLGRTPEGMSLLPPDLSVPAAGQGFLAVQGRAGDDPASLAAGPLGGDENEACLGAERALLAALGGGCREPIGAFCSVAGPQLTLMAFAAEDAHGTGARWAQAVGEAGAISDLVSRVVAGLDEER